MSVVDDLIRANTQYAETFPTGLSAQPTHGLAVLTCMDCRLDPLRALGLDLGTAHILRNAGGVVTEDVLRSLAISQHKLNSRGIMLIQHTRCGLTSFSDTAFRTALEADTGSTPPWKPQPFGEQQQNVREDLDALRSSPFIPYCDQARGFIIDVDTGLLHEVVGS